MHLGFGNLCLRSRKQGTVLEVVYLFHHRSYVRIPSARGDGLLYDSYSAIKILMQWDPKDTLLKKYMRLANCFGIGAAA